MARESEPPRDEFPPLENHQLLREVREASAAVRAWPAFLSGSYPVHVQALRTPRLPDGAQRSLP